MLGLKLLGSAALITWLVERAGVGHIAHTLRGASMWWLGLGFVLGVVAALMQANQLRGLLVAYGVPITYRRSVEVDSAARLFDAALPTNIGGDAVRIGLAVRSREDTARAAVAVVLRRLMSIPGLVVLITLGALSSWHLDYSANVRVIALFSVLGAVVLAVVVALSRHLTVRLVHRLPGPVRKVVATFAAAGGVASDQHPLLRATARGFAFWVAVIASQACYAEAVHVDAPLEYMIAVVTAVNILSLLPISLGGYGLREGIFSVLLGVRGVATATQGAAVGVCVSAQTLIFGLVGGVFYLAIRRQRAHSETNALSNPTPAGQAQPDLTGGVVL